MDLSNPSSQFTSKLSARYIIYAALGLMAVSFLSYFSKITGIAGFGFFAVLMLVLGLWRREYALYLAYLELILGSFGYLLSIYAGGLNLSLRMAFFVIIIALYIYDFLRNRVRIPHSAFRIPLVFFGGIWIIGVIRGYLRGYELSNIFFDANSYLYLLLLFPAALWLNNEEKIKNLLKVILAGSLFLAAETFALFIIFSRGTNLFLLEIFYKWIRDFRIGELTSLKTGAYRIFIQSQIYLLVGFLFVAVKYFYHELKTAKFIFFAVLYGAAIYISLSRSLWVGLFAAVLILLALLIKFFGLKSALYKFLKLSLVFYLGVLLVTAAIPKKVSLIGDRLKIGETALSTRIEQLKPLLPAIKNNSFFGYGFGKTLTFKSFDPRVTYVTKDGSYTTYAFEWGYLDIILKIGFLGLAFYFYFIGNIIYRLFKRLKFAPVLNLWAITSLAALLVTHIFTPYLNHPLGIGILILGVIIARLKN